MAAQGKVSRTKVLCGTDALAGARFGLVGFGELRSREDASADARRGLARFCEAWRIEAS